LDSDYLNLAALDVGEQFARKAVLLDPNLPEAHVGLGFILAFKHQHDASMASIERALSLNPNYVDWRLGWPLILAGHSRRAIDVLDTYMRLDPFHPPLCSFFQGAAHFMLEEYSQAITLLKDFMSRVPQTAFGHLWLAATYARLGQLDEARANVAEVLRLRPGYTISEAGRRLAGFKHGRDDKHFFGSLRKAGMPE
jgi:adenylate cyclase